MVLLLGVVGVRASFNQSWPPNPNELGFLGAYLVGTLYLSPDIDQAATGYSRSLNRWSLLRLLWVPYGLMFPHRGTSHTYLLGPLSRLVYLWLLAFPILAVLGFKFGLLVPLRDLPWVGIAAGYFLSQWAHLVLDGVPPWRLW